MSAESLAADLPDEPEVVEAPAPEPAVPDPGASYPENSVEADVARALATERARDEKGRFTKTVDEAPVEAAPAAKNPDPQPKAAATSPKDRSAPPPGWTAEAKAEWSAMSPAQKAAAWQREDNYADGISKKNREIEAFAPVKALLDQNAERFTRLGVDAPTALRQLLTFQEMFEREPVKLIQHIVQAHRLDLRQLAQTPTASAPPASATQPARPNVVPDINSIVSQQLDARDAQRQIAEFMADPANKHASDPTVKAAMAAALAAGAPNLKEAYDRAIWSLPNLREGLLADRQAAEAKARADKVAASKAAAISLKGGSPGGAKPASMAAKPNGSGDVYDDVRAAIASLNGRT